MSTWTCTSVCLVVAWLVVGGAAAAPNSKVRIIDDYVLSANFDDSVSVPQIGAKGKRISREDAGYLKGEQYPPYGSHVEEEANDVEVYDSSEMLKERDLVLPAHHAAHHHHHHAAPIPGPPPGPPIQPNIITPYSVFAVGFVSFLILLSGLQTSLTMMVLKPKGGGLLGGLAGGGAKPGRKRRRR